VIGARDGAPTAACGLVDAVQEALVATATTWPVDG
jgi:hypothetical protein